MGSAWTPCVRPISGVSLNSHARFSRTSPKRVDIFFDQLRGFADEQRLRGVHHVIRGEAVVQPARRFGIADRFLHGDGEGDHVMADFGFDFVDARDVNAGAFAQFRGGFARHDACFGERFRGGQLDVQPLLELVFFAPDAAHFRARVSCDQAWLLRHLLAPEKPACEQRAT